ncbi:unnamed protein product [Effrenium voratum]|nr:unnamed protein product [Effrenium voratum]
MDKDEIHHKMSKKVAQLTKVIFHLNTRNDEADQHLVAVTQAYETEVQQILKDANAKLRKLSEVVWAGQQSCQAARGPEEQLRRREARSFQRNSECEVCCHGP